MEISNNTQSKHLHTSFIYGVDAAACSVAQPLWATATVASWERAFRVGILFLKITKGCAPIYKVLQLP